MEGNADDGEVNNCTECIDPNYESVGEIIPGLDMEVIRCVKCQKCREILVGKKKLVSISNAIQIEKESNGWQEVSSLDERQILFILIQILHNEGEIENGENSIEFTLPPITDQIKILWEFGQAIGFYSVKLKGTFDLETMTSYSMPTLDTIFIRKPYRRRGFGLTALQSLRTDFPSDKIGFSYPLTSSMRQVLWKHLNETREDRIRFWEVTDPWANFSRNIWLTIQRERKAS